MNHFVEKQRKIECDRTDTGRVDTTSQAGSELIHNETTSESEDDEFAICVYFHGYLLHE